MSRTIHEVANSSCREVSHGRSPEVQPNPCRLAGRRVKTLARGEWKAGYHSLTWNARDGQGRRVSPGMYLYRMIAGSFSATRKLVVLP